MPDSRHTVLWGLVVARAARHGRPASAGDVCEVAVTAARVNGGWVTVAGGPGPDFLTHVTDPVSEWLAELQLTLGEGPCHDVQVSEGLSLGSDLEDAQSGRRWPVFAPAAMQRGARAVFAFPLTIGSIRVGVMGLYRDSAGPLPAAQLRDCLLLADTATVLLIKRPAAMASSKPETVTGPGCRGTGQPGPAPSGDRPGHRDADGAARRHRCGGVRPAPGLLLLAGPATCGRGPRHRYPAPAAAARLTGGR